MKIKSIREDRYKSVTELIKKKSRENKTNKFYVIALKAPISFHRITE